MSVWSLSLASLIKLIQLIQKDRGIEFPVVLIAEALHSLVDSVLILLVE